MPTSRTTKAGVAPAAAIRELLRATVRRPVRLGVSRGSTILHLRLLPLTPARRALVPRPKARPPRARPSRHQAELLAQLAEHANLRPKTTSQHWLRAL